MMKLATIRDGSRDGLLVVVSQDNRRYLPAPAGLKTLQKALDDWHEAEPLLQIAYQQLQADPESGTLIQMDALDAPLPRAYEWVDGSAYINHIELVRKARGVEPPPTLKTDPLVYQGGSGCLLAAHDPIILADEAWGCDFEAEICVILADTPQGTKARDASKYVRLITICNDVSLRNLIPEELQKGFGFFLSKPATAFAPFVVTPDELGGYWRDGRCHLPLRTELNGQWFGDPDAGPEMHFSFFDLIEHICRTRSFVAGTILGSGTVSNRDPNRGSSCLAEKRMLEKINEGEIKTPFLNYGDNIRIDMQTPQGASLFGEIHQTVRQL
jgi:fumarylacetoacetate (FAA) hydrolase